MAKVISAADAAALIKDGDTVAFSGFGLSCVNQEVIAALEERWIGGDGPHGLTIINSSAVGARGKREGLSKLSYEGLVKRWIGGIMSASPDLGKLAAENKLECYNLPQGVITALYREIAARRPGVITKVGLGTFVDPRLEGAKVNDVTTEDLVKLVELDGDEYLFYRAFPIDIGLIRGTYADEAGNLTMEQEGLKMEILPIAQAVHNSGGIVIAQAKTVVQTGSLDPNLVRVPGNVVDYIVVSEPENHMQTEYTQYNPAFSGQVKVPVSGFKPIPLTERKVMARRAAAEIRPGDVMNLGVGVPAEVGVIMSDEGISDYALLTTEAGAVGGTAADDKNFGHSYNALAQVGMHEQFDYYDGGGLDLTILGLAQADSHGNLNVSKFNGRVAGCGGFINITATAKRVVFAGTFTAGGLKVQFGEGRCEIVEEGRIHKFVRDVEQVTFSGARSAAIGQKVVYVTERAVFELRDGEVVLTEIAPGIDLKKHILEQMDFRPAIAADLKEMDPGLFREEWGNLRTTIDARVAAEASQ
ncbi:MULTISPECIES: CoA-transferase [unclassified Actinobaculum]|uniref:acyl CoA:acetate/3-ketoacid CoA transferase n=1 Tax=unclassified Actinobaculum TaxID=2609299 RepID=UPI000D52612D|nr:MULTISPECIES: CoA-transferase [unclassified Actinobaculum]AWE43098.1 acyl CoA:acetate/3-ketoacid CoA transferase [Actinobaculum sp. 313]RTE48517.1 acyl CoA:acetate/3-ketoacid CoA transferase [Actinobaculum sp. 352]